MKNRAKLWWVSLAIKGALFGAFALAGCQGEPQVTVQKEAGSPYNPAVCAKGVLDTTNPDCRSDSSFDAGKCCVNPANNDGCFGEEKRCIDGYYCDFDGYCKSISNCSTDSNCKGSQKCVGGVCKNPDTCQVDLDCLKGHFCNSETNTCVMSGCGVKGCERGICDEKTGTCINRPGCSKDKSISQCVEGYTCLEERKGTVTKGSCVLESEVCSHLGCYSEETRKGRGVCNVKGGKCKNSQACDNKSFLCLSGYTCINQLCVDDVCLTTRNKCVDGLGVCDPATGICSNKDECNAASDCMKGFVCLKKTGSDVSTCVAEDDICPEKCVGRTFCNYNQTTREAGCIEQFGGKCIDSLDCIGQRVCSEGKCQDPADVKCDNDIYDLNSRNNDSIEEAVDVDQYSSWRNKTDFSGSLILCPSPDDGKKEDVDIFRLNVGSYVGTKNLMLVEFVIENGDTGIGVIHASLQTSGGTILTKTSSNEDGTNSQYFTLKVDFDSLNINESTLYLVVRAEHSKKIALPYNFKTRTVNKSLLGVCGDADRIVTGPTDPQRELNKEVTIDPKRIVRVGVHSCSNVDSTVIDYVTAVDVKEDSQVTFKVESLDAEKENFTPVLALRTDCYLNVSELAGTCVVAEKKGTEATLVKYLKKGTYFLYVTNAQTLASHFKLTVKSKAPECLFGAKRCDDKKIRICTENGEWGESEECPGGNDSCVQPEDATLAAYCPTPEGASCTSLKKLVLDDKQEQLTLDLDFSFASANVSPAASCPDIVSESSSGRELFFSVTVPKGKVFVASVERPGAMAATTDYSLYAYETTSCTKLTEVLALSEKACVLSSDKGKDGVTETISLDNVNGTSDRSFIVIVDSKKLSDLEATPRAKLYVKISGQKCVPGFFSCTPQKDASRQCNEVGTDYILPVTVCQRGCVAKDDKNPDLVGKCLPAKGDSCKVVGEGADKSEPIKVTIGTEEDYSLKGLKDLIPDPEMKCQGLTDDRTGKEDMVFVIDQGEGKPLIAGTTIDIEVTPTKGTESHMVWVLETCNPNDGTANTCVVGANASRKAAKLTYLLPASKDKIYFVVEGTDADSDSYEPFDFKLKVDVAAPDTACIGKDPQYVIGCNASGKVEWCLANSQRDGIECGCTPEGATGFSCGTASGNRKGKTPYDAIILDPAETDSSKRTLVADTYNAAQLNFLEIDQPRAGQCIFGPERASVGYETFYEIKVAAGKTLQAKTLSGSKSQVYILEDCLDKESCVGFHNNIGTGAISTYHNYDAAEKTVCIVVDSYDKPKANTKNNVKVQWSFVDTATVCAPNSFRCNTAKDSVISCSEDGSTETTIACPTGTTCNRGACALAPVTDATCSGVIDAGTGGTFYVEKDLSKKSQFALACTGQSKGAEAMVKVSAKKDQIIHALGYTEGGDAASISISKGCPDSDSACIAGAVGTSSSRFLKENVATIKYQVKEDGDYYIGLDSKTDDSGSGYYYSIQVTDPECATNAVSCHPTKSNTIRYCLLGVWKELRCDTGTCNKATNSCDTALGKTCGPNAIRLVGNQGTINKPNHVGIDANDYVVPQSVVDVAKANGSYLDSCIFGATYSLTGALNYASRGTRDKFFYVWLDAGDVFSVEFTGVGDSWEIPYLLDGCFEDGGSCVYTGQKNTYKFDPTEFKHFQAYKAGYYYFVVPDWNSDPSSYAWTFNYKISPPASALNKTDAFCVPFSAQCIDSTTLSICNSNGSAITKTVCPFGCKGASCIITVAGNNTCSDDVPLLKSSFTVVASTRKSGNGFTSHISPPSDLACGSVSIKSRYMAGNDYIFKVELEPFATVSVFGRSASNYSEYSAYLLTKCASVPTTCIAGGFNNKMPDKYEVGKIMEPYRNGRVTSTYYLVLDGRSNDDNGIQFYVQIDKAECDPTNFPFVCNGKNQIEMCTSDAKRQPVFDCNLKSGGCSENDFACRSPQSDTCYDAKRLEVDTNGKASVIGTFADFTNVYDLKPSARCTGSSAPGADAVYSVDLEPGKTLTASVVSTETSPEDVAIYLLDSCINAAAPVHEACVVGSDAVAADPTPETVTYKNSSPGGKRVYLVVDSYYAATKGEFKLEVHVQ